MIKKYGILPVIFLISLLIVGCSRNNSFNSASNYVSSDNQSKKMSPILTQDIIETANNYKYDFDPKAVSIKKQDSYDYSNEELSQLQVGEIREDHHLVYVFEGAYIDGYYDVNTTGHMYLWDDGLFAALINETTVKGYWYNTLTEAGENCLVLLSNQTHYEQIIANICDNECYLYEAEVFVTLSWGFRNMLIKGYYFYPEVAISFLDYSHHNFAYKVRDIFNPDNEFTVVRILKDLHYIPTLETEKGFITWDIPDGMLDSSYRLINAGYFTVTAHYKSFSNNLVIEVKQ